MTTRESIERFLKKSTEAMLLLAILKGLLRFIPFGLIGLSLLAVFDHWMEFPSWLMKILWWGLVLAGGGLFGSAFFPIQMFSAKQKSKALVHRINGRWTAKSREWRVDDLYLVRQFLIGKKCGDTSEHLVDEYMRIVEERLRECQPSWCFPEWRWRRPVILTVLLLLTSGSLWALLPSYFMPVSRVLFPFGSYEWIRLLEIEPGDRVVPWGKDALITIRLRESAMEKPSLFVKVGTEWQSLPPSSESAKSSVYELKNIVEPLVYRVLWKREWSRKYTLTPIEPVRIQEFHVRLDPPAYAQKETQTQSQPEITGLPGTRVSMEVLANMVLRNGRILFSDGRAKDIEKVEGNKFYIGFIIDKEMTYSFAVSGLDGQWRDNEAFYPIHLIEDHPPTVLLLSPDSDLVAGDKEKIPLTYDARDDFGVKEITLVWDISGHKQGRTQVNVFEKPLETTMGTFLWDLSQSEFKSGDVIRYRLEVVDGNTVTGPGKAESEWRVLEIASFEEEHAGLEKALEDWRDKTVDLLAQVNTLKARTDSENPDLSSMVNDFNKIAQNSEQLENYLKQIVSKMENDPMADYGVWLEHKAMENSLSQMNDTTVKGAQSAFQTQNKQAASSRLDQMASELERMAALSEELSKTQKARDVLDSGDTLEKLGQDLVERLESGSLDKELLSEINKLISEAQENLIGLAQSLQDMPQELPEDFVNQAALKDLDLGQSQDILSQLQDAIRRGDAKSALALAKQFLKMAQDMRSKLGEAHESYVESHSASDLAEKISEQQQVLDQIIQEQTDVLSNTQKLESKRLESMLKAQQELLASLAKRQRKLTETAKELLFGELARTPVNALWSSQIRPMEEVVRELEQKQIDRSLDLLSAIIVQMTAAETELQRSTSTLRVGGEVKAVREEEASILEVLKNPTEPKMEFSGEDQEKFDELNKRQAELMQKTQGVKNKLQVLSRKTANLGLPLMQSLGQAGAEMAAASGKLGANDSRLAQGHEEKALDHLLNGQSALNQARSNLSEMGMQQEGGGGSGGVKAVFRPGQSSSQGRRTGKVRLPRAEDYRPPKEFREDLLEALKEKYPKIYEDIIQKYYKRLVE